MILFIMMIVLISSILTPNYCGWYGPHIHYRPRGFARFMFGPRHHGPMHHGHMHHRPMGGHHHGPMHHGPHH